MSFCRHIGTVGDDEATSRWRERTAAVDENNANATAAAAVRGRWSLELEGWRNSRCGGVFVSSA